MSLYNYVIGENPDTNNLLYMLKVDRNFFGRFRNVYLSGDGQTIIVYTRLGGPNREYWKEYIDNIRKHKDYIEDWDDDFDETYAYFRFKVPYGYKTKCKSICTGEDPKTVQEQFDEEIRNMDDPNSEAAKKAEELAKMLEKAAESGSKINVIEL